MATIEGTTTDPRPRAGNGAHALGPREQLLAGLPVTERQLDLAGVSTAILEGGSGPPLILLHGPGESAANWRWVIRPLIRSHHVIAPDLPAHGSTEVPNAADLEAGVLAWLGALIDEACEEAPDVVGHVLGGAIGARFAIAHGDALSRLVLVDSLGLSRFRPSPRFAIGMAGFLARPNERSYHRFMRQCAFDLDSLRDRVGDDWEPFVAHNLELANAPESKAAGKLFRSLGVPRIPADELARIKVPTSLIWGRHDRALRLRIAEEASARYGWPLQVIEESADDPMRDQPQEFVHALGVALGSRVAKP